MKNPPAPAPQEVARKEELPSSRKRHRPPLPSVFERQFDSAGHRNTLSLGTAAHRPSAFRQLPKPS
jgi:hypothetical protein